MFIEQPFKSKGQNLWSHEMKELRDVWFLRVHLAHWVAEARVSHSITHVAKSELILAIVEKILEKTRAYVEVFSTSHCTVSSHLRHIGVAYSNGSQCEVDRTSESREDTKPREEDFWRLG